MGRRLWLLPLILLTGKLVSLELLSKDCNETFGVKIRTSAVRYASSQYQTRCGFWGLGRCRKYRQTSFQVAIYETKISYRPACCPGSVPLNETACSTTCPEGKYGDNCTHNCTCPPTGAWDVNCDRQNGNCSCQNGYHGENCDLTCDQGYFGSNCLEMCLCQNNSTCNPINGSCNCSTPGWTGELCDEGCSKSRYGTNCQFECNCTINETCKANNGECVCKAGLGGENCNTACTNFSFGVGCRGKCNCNRENSMGCDPVDGQCLCKPGWEGQTCASVCSTFRYGANCSYECPCNASEFCDPSDGTCYSNLCHTPTTLNCDRYDEMITCIGWNTSKIRHNSLPMEYKLYNVCASLDVSNQNEVCLTVEECKCSPGFTGSYCSQELNADVGGQTEKSSNSTPIITGVSIGVVVVVIILLSIVVFTIRTRNTKQDNAAVDNKTYGLTDLRKHDGIFPNAANMNSNRPQSTNFANLSANLEDDAEYDRLSRHNQPNINHNQAVDSEDTYTHMTNQNTQTNDEYDVAGRNPHFNSPDSTEYGYSNSGLQTSDYDELDRNSKGRRKDHSSSTYSS